MKKFFAAAIIAALALSGCRNSDKEDTNLTSGNGGNVESNNNEDSEEEFVLPQGYSWAEVKDPSLYDLQFTMPENGEEIAVMQTNMGDIKIRFFPEEAPLAVENFKGLAQSGFYEGVTFHRVMKDFMIQGGDPDGTGRGHYSFFDNESFNDEFVPYLHNYRGSLSMANSGPNTNSSQFFINQASDVYEEYLTGYMDAAAEDPDFAEQNVNKMTFDRYGDIFSEKVAEHYREVGGNIHLDYRHTVFGQVFEGMDIVDKIAEVETDEDDKPVSPVTIERIYFENCEG